MEGGADKPKQAHRFLSETLGSETESLTQELLLDQREHIDRYISIADTKAGFLIGLLSAVMLGLYQSSARHPLRVPVNPWTATGFLFVIALVFLAAAVSLSMFVVRPRLINTAKKGLIPWLGISSFRSREEYLRSLSAATRSQLIEDLASNVYDLSKIARKKYDWLRWSFLAGGLGLITGLLSYVLISLKG